MSNHDRSNHDRRIMSENPGVYIAMKSAVRNIIIIVYQRAGLSECFEEDGLFRRSEKLFSAFSRLFSVQNYRKSKVNYKVNY